MAELIDAPTNIDRKLCQQFGRERVDWLLAAQTLKTTISDKDIRREMRLDSLKDLAEGLILCARQEQRRALLSILPRIKDEVAREKHHPSVDFSRLNRLLRYFERVAGQQEKEIQQTMETKALILGADYLPDVAEAALNRAGFEPMYLQSFTQCLPWPEHARALIFHHKKNSAPRLAQMKNLLKMLPADVRKIIITPEDDFKIRAASVEAGFDHTITYPIDSARLTSVLESAQTAADRQSPITVLMVDDLLTTGAYWRKHFRDQNIHFLFESKPEQAYEVALSQAPDVILLDLYMPEVDGVDFARILREHPRLSDVPILFLSTEDHDRPRLEAKLQGGDDFLSKQIDPEDLVRVVHYRAQRFRRTMAARQTDSLTGLLNHRAIKNMVDTEMDRATRQNQPFTVAMIDIDNFKYINDTYGHLTGDRVIRRLSTLLNTRLRRYDGVGRYGGEEFLLALPATDVSTAERLVNELRVSFAEDNIYADNGEKLNCRFSGGIACFPDHITADEIIAAADQALYQAKNSGRNRVCRDQPVHPLPARGAAAKTG